MLLLSQYNVFVFVHFCCYLCASLCFCVLVLLCTVYVRLNLRDGGSVIIRVVPISLASAFVAGALVLHEILCKHVHVCLRLCACIHKVPHADAYAYTNEYVCISVHSHVIV